MTTRDKHLKQPGISCVCMTYGRTWLLAEAVEAFMRQDWQGHKELIIVNDYEGITLRKGAVWPGAIVNLPKRMSSLNDKFDLGVNMAQYPLVCMWDDDDISLPHRLTDSVNAWEMASEPDYLAFTHHLNMDEGKAPTLIDRGIHGADIFTKDAYLRLGGSKGKGHNDENFVAKVRANGSYATWDNSISPSYIYRWGGICGHHSAYARDVKTCMARFHDEVTNSPRFKLGMRWIVPRWSQDFTGLVNGCKP